MSGVLRSLPDFAPTEVSRMIGTPRRVLASAPFDASKVSACLRAQSSVLGAYSPVSGTAAPLVRGRTILPRRLGASGARRDPGARALRLRARAAGSNGPWV